MASLPGLRSLFTMKFHGFSETFKAVVFKPKGGRRKDKDSSQTAPPGPSPSPEPKQYLDEQMLEARLVEADLAALVQLPPNVDCNEWLATHTVSFFNHVNQMYGVIAEYCTPQSCPTMAGPDNVHYPWHDEKGRKVKLSAPQHVDQLMSSVQKLVADESIFPTKFGHTFPPDFPDTVRRIQRHLFQVLAHIYHCHYSRLVTLGLHGHLNTIFSHFMVFSTHFHLLPDKDAEVLMDLHKALLNTTHDSQAAPSSSQHLSDPHLDTDFRCTTKPRPGRDQNVPPSHNLSHPKDSARLPDVHHHVKEQDVLSSQNLSPPKDSTYSSHVDGVGGGGGGRKNDSAHDSLHRSLQRVEVGGPGDNDGDTA